MQVLRGLAPKRQQREFFTFLSFADLTRTEVLKLNKIRKIKSKYGVFEYAIGLSCAEGDHHSSLDYSTMIYCCISGG